MDCSTIVNTDASRISRSLFTDEAIYRAELEQIFGRAWLMVGHESQVREPGDFVRSRMGEESVIVSRGRDRELNVLHNSCAHRAMKVCRVDSGSARTLTCPYHGWQYGIDGALVGVPHQVDGYGGELDKSEWGLRRARVETYRGLIFATFGAQAPSLTDYLGDVAWYLDLMFDRHPDGTELVGGVHRWIVDCNWKMPAENQAPDTYHADVSHAATFGLQGTGTADAFPGGTQVTVEPGHFMLVDRVVSDGDPIRLLPGDGRSRQPDVADWLRGVQPVAEARLGPVRSRLRLAVGTVFPNFSVLPSTDTIRMAHPLGPGRTEIWSWCLVPAAAPEGVKRTMRSGYMSGFGPAGMIEVEDGENWSEMTRGCVSALPEDRPMNVGMGVGAEFTDPELPGTLAPLWSEANQRAFYRTWRRFMEQSE